MRISKTQFYDVMQDLIAGRNVKETAIAHLLSERQVRRIKEAGTWERWPYIVAKATHGYNTPEYKAYLKRRGLPLTIPPKTVALTKKSMQGSYSVSVNPDMFRYRPSLWQRLKKRIGLK